uniref:Uncharacterized protein n=1 Tax=Arundo donax TaxID=35708 RepID=A0A0A9BH06_ARUDO
MFKSPVLEGFIYFYFAPGLQNVRAGPDLTTLMGCTVRQRWKFGISVEEIQCGAIVKEGQITLTQKKR